MHTSTSARTSSSTSTPDAPDATCGSPSRTGQPASGAGMTLRQRRRAGSPCRGCGGLRCEEYPLSISATTSAWSCIRAGQRWCFSGRISSSSGGPHDISELDRGTARTPMTVCLPRCQGRSQGGCAARVKRRSAKVVLDLQPTQPVATHTAKASTPKATAAIAAVTTASSTARRGPIERASTRNTHAPTTSPAPTNPAGTPRRGNRRPAPGTASSVPTNTANANPARCRSASLGLCTVPA